MKLKRKIITIFLSCFLFISSSISSYAIAPAFALALANPQLIASICTVLVGAGVNISSERNVLDVISLAHQNLGDSKFNALKEEFVNNCKVTSNKAIRLSSNFVDTVKTVFDDIFKTADEGQITNIITQGVSIDRNFPTKISAVEGSSITTSNFQLVNLANSSVMHFKMYDGTFKTVYCPWKILEISIDWRDVWLQIRYLNSDGSSSGTGYPTHLRGVADAPTVDFPYVPGSYDWDAHVKPKISPDGTLDVYVPSDAGVFPDISTDKDKVFEGDVSYPVSDNTVAIPNIDNPSIDIDKDIDLPSIDAGNPPINPPLDPPIDPDIPLVSIDFSPLWTSMQNIKTKFPFSLPWDLHNLFVGFDVEPVAPKWQFSLLGNKVDIDFSAFNDWANIVKFFVYISFFISLIVISNKLKP